MTESTEASSEIKENDDTQALVEKDEKAKTEAVETLPDEEDTPSDNTDLLDSTASDLKTPPDTTQRVPEKNDKERGSITVGLLGQHESKKSPEVIVDPRKLHRHSKNVKHKVHKPKSVTPKYSRPLPKPISQQLKPLTPPLRKPRTKRHGKLKSFLTIILSFLLLLLYVVGGAYLFSSREVAHEREYSTQIDRWKNDTAILLATELRQVKPHEEVWAKTVFKYLDLFERDLLDASAKGYRREDGRNREQIWTWNSAFFFSLSLLTTTGYGSMSPRSEYGRGAVYFYSCVGVPLMISWLLAVGNFFAYYWASVFGCFSLHDENSSVSQDQNASVTKRKDEQKTASTKPNSVAPIKERRLNDEHRFKELKPLIHPVNPTMNNGVNPHFYRAQDTVVEYIVSGDKNLHLSIKCMAVALSILFFDAYFIIGSLIIAFYEGWAIPDSLYFNHLMFLTLGPGCHELNHDSYEINIKHKLYYSAYLFVGYCLLSSTANLVYILFFVRKTVK